MQTIAHSKTTLGEKDFQAVANRLQSGLITGGELNREFSTALASYTGQSFCGLYSSGTTAFHELLLALKQTSGADEVLIPNYICPSVLPAVVKAGLKPVIYDAASGSYLPNFTAIESLVSEQTLACLLNPTFGELFTVPDSLLAANIPLILDSCHHVSSMPAYQKLMTQCVATFCSFNATKMLASGEGGAVATNNQELADLMDASRLDAGMSDLNCALALAQLEQVDAFVKKRIDLAGIYEQKINWGDTVRNVSADHCYYRYVFQTPRQEAFLSHESIGFRKGVDCLLSNDEAFSQSRALLQTTVSIPIYPLLTEEEVLFITDEMNRMLEE